MNTNLSISEDEGELEFEIAVLQGNLRINVPVDFATADGSASGRSMQFHSNLRLHSKLIICSWTRL